MNDINDKLIPIATGGPIKCVLCGDAARVIAVTPDGTPYCVPCFDKIKIKHKD
jgi:hypothetical protein